MTSNRASKNETESTYNRFGADTLTPESTHWPMGLVVSSSSGIFYLPSVPFFRPLIFAHRSDAGSLIDLILLVGLDRGGRAIFYADKIFVSVFGVNVVCTGTDEYPVPTPAAVESIVAVVVHDPVIITSSIERVVAATTFNHISTAPSVDGVIAGATIQFVAARSAFHDVGVVATSKVVDAATTVHSIRAVPPSHGVIAREAPHGIVCDDTQKGVIAVGAVARDW
jgi:hypothetical protein